MIMPKERTHVSVVPPDTLQMSIARTANVPPPWASTDRHGRVLSRRLTEQTVYDRLRHLAARAGVAAFSPHDCRRSIAGDLLDAGVDLATVQAMLGHASPSTTARYDRRGEHPVRQAASRIHVPYSGVG